MKTILYVYHVASVGGGSYCLLNILRAVDRSKFKPIVLLREFGPLVEEIQKLGIEVFFFPQMQIGLYNKSLCRYSSIKRIIFLEISKIKFKKIIGTINPDYLYYNTMMLHPYLEVTKKMGIRSIIHVREHWPEKEHSWQRSIAINNVLHYADEVVAINSYSASMCKRFKRPVTIVYDWIDMKSRFLEMPLNGLLGEDCSNLKVYLFTGGLQEIKGTREVIETFTKEIKDTNSRLLLLGIPCNKPTFSGIKGLIKNWAKFFGYKDYNDIVYSMIQSDSRIVCASATYNLTHILQQVYCVLSYFKIPHANLALAESIICHTPYIAAETEESLEYSKNGELAVLYKMNDRESFRSAIEELTSYVDVLKAKIQKDSIIIEEMFDSIQNINALNGVYQRLES